MNPRDTLTVAEAAALMSRPAGGKYHARRTYVPELERWFASAHEAEQAVILWRRQRAGEIRNLRFQVRYPLQVNGVHVCEYVSDFVYEEYQEWRPSWGEWAPVVADAKGFRTPTYKIKKALVRAVLGITIVEL